MCHGTVRKHIILNVKVSRSRPHTGARAHISLCSLSHVHKRNKRFQRAIVLHTHTDVLTRALAHWFPHTLFCIFLLAGCGRPPVASLNVICCQIPRLNGKEGCRAAPRSHRSDNQTSQNHHISVAKHLFCKHCSHAWMRWIPFLLALPNAVWVLDTDSYKRLYHSCLYFTPSLETYVTP